MSEKLTKTQRDNLARLGGVNPADAPISRRRLIAGVGSLAAVGGVVGAGLLVRDRWGMAGIEPPPPVRLKPFNVPEMPGKPALVVVRSTPVPTKDRPPLDVSRDREEQALRMVRAALEEMGGVERFITRGDVVVVKPNVAFDKNPDLGATTQPDTVAAVVRLCKGAGARKVIVCDNPINNPESCFLKTKVGEAAERAGAELMLPKASAFEQLHIGGETIKTTWSMFYKPFREATKVIGVSPVKDHNLCKATVTMKNWYGLLGNPRNQFHQDIHGIIADFALMMKPTLVIADARKILMQHGPTGGSLNDVRASDAIIVGTDHVAVDSYVVGHPDLLARNRSEILYLDKAINRGLGRDWDAYKISEDLRVDG